MNHHGTGPDGKESPDGEREQSYQTISGYGGVQNTLQVQRWHHATRNASEVFHKGKATSSLFNRPQISRWHRQEGFKKTQSIWGGGPHQPVKKISTTRSCSDINTIFFVMTTSPSRQKSAR